MVVPTRQRGLGENPGRRLGTRRVRVHTGTPRPCRLHHLLTMLGNTARQPGLQARSVQAEVLTSGSELQALGVVHTHL